MKQLAKARSSWSRLALHPVWLVSSPDGLGGHTHGKYCEDKGGDGVMILWTKAIGASEPPEAGRKTHTRIYITLIYAYLNIYIWDLSWWLSW